MDYDPSDSSGTDDDLPPSHQNRVTKGGRVTGNGRSAVGGAHPFNNWIQSDMETQIHLLEQEAYSSVLRAFKAQSNVITWEKESLITELRKELRVSDEEHRELLGKVNADDIIQRIREWRQGGGGLLSTSQPVHDALPSPTVSVSRKKQKTSLSVPHSLSLGAPSPTFPHKTLAGPLHPSSLSSKRGAAVRAMGQKPKSGQMLPGVSSMKYHAGRTGLSQVANQGSSGALIVNESAEASGFDSLIGRKVMTRWPEDNSFYDAVITDYDPVKGLHALVYDINSVNETWEWVNLKEISPEDIQWVGEDPGIRAGRGGLGRGIKKSTGRGSTVPSAGRGRGAPKTQTKKDFLPSQNGIGKKKSDDIEILHTDTLIKEVERVFGATNPDPLEVEKARKILKEHEQALIDAIARLADASDGESEETEHLPSNGKSAWRNQQQNGVDKNAEYDENDGCRGRDDDQASKQTAKVGRTGVSAGGQGDEANKDI